MRLISRKTMSAKLKRVLPTYSCSSSRSRTQGSPTSAHGYEWPLAESAVPPLSGRSCLLHELWRTTMQDSQGGPARNPITCRCRMADPKVPCGLVHGVSFHRVRNHRPRAVCRHLAGLQGAQIELHVTQFPEKACSKTLFRPNFFGAITGGYCCCWKMSCSCIQPFSSLTKSRWSAAKEIPRVKAPETLKLRHKGAKI